MTSSPLLGAKKRQSLDRREQDAVRLVVRRAREAAGLSRKELSERLDRHHSFLSRIEAGTRTLDVVELMDLASALGTSAEALMAQVSQALSDWTPDHTKEQHGC